MKWTQVSIEEAEQMLENHDVLLLDMRDHLSYLAGHHRRAIHLNDMNLKALLKHTARSVPVLIYCYHGHRSQDMAQLFSDFGFTSCYSLKGGYEAWYPEFCMAERELSDELIEWQLWNHFDPENLDHRADNNETALMRLCREGNADLALELVEAGATLQLINEDGNNALWMAVQSGNELLVEALLRAGTPIDQQNDNGATVLMLAMTMDMPVMVRLLLASGANTELTTVDGFRAEDAAVSKRVLNQLKGWNSYQPQQSRAA
ncbi:rhodanese-like domain-containing protein [Oceanobacter mangrovi]|uniref:rhodanese-like domain-containing protein n=1 Tax=Oceanobacter mangrovi TaxID=2862510 RepID=UPI001C8D5389|nr:rhodanese-like domain-containing protein [Oceanobacter mangrovi]